MRTFKIELKIRAEKDAVINAYTDHRRFLLSGLGLRAGETFEGSFAAAAGEADFQKQANYRDEAVALRVAGCREYEAKTVEARLPVIYCLGDSTVCDQPYDGGGPMDRCCGWGQTLPMYLGGGFAVSNHAEQGTHTGDCLKCHILPVLRQLRPGDAVLVQFGHNDQKQPWLRPYDGYRENLRKIAELVGEKGGRCVLCTPINRLIYVDGRLNDYLDEYAAAVRDLAGEMGLGCIDLQAFTTETYLRMGERAGELFYHPPAGPLDRTHPNDIGGKLIGEYVSEYIKRNF